MASSGLKWSLGGLLVLLLAAGGEVLWIHHKNAEGDAPVKKVEYKSDPDDLVFVKSEHPMTFKDAKDLKGRTLWISAGGQMVYYPYNGHSIDFGHSVGMLLSTEKVLVKDAVEQVAAKDRYNRIPPGDKQVFVIFTKPNDKDPAKEYAVPVGTKQGADYTFSTDQIFFYDDPHVLFAHWGPEIWKAVDEHRAIVGMTEREAQTALGQVSDPHGDRIGERTVIYDNQDKPVRITFSGSKATKIENVQP